MEKMLELDKRLHLVARLPPAQELVGAFRAFIQSKWQTKAPIEDFHASQLLQTLRMIENPESVQQGNAQVTTEEDCKLGEKDFAILFEVLNETASSVYTKEHNSLAKAAWEALQTLRAHAASSESDTQDVLSWKLKLGYVRVLCATGDTVLAKDAVESLNTGSQRNISLWMAVVAGFAREDNETDLLRAFEHTKIPRKSNNPLAQRVVATFYARKNDIANAKRWFDPIVLQDHHNGDPAGTGVVPNSIGIYETLLQFCLRNNELQWGQGIIEKATAEEDGSSDLKTWNAIFLASASAGKSVDDIDRMFGVMKRRATGEDQPDKTSILNGLIRLAISRTEPYLAERYFSLLQKYDAQPNNETFILQIEYRILAGDLDGALASYDKLRRRTILDNEDYPIMNTLLQTLLTRPETPNETIMGLAADLSERKKTFPAPTVRALCTYHLTRDEYFELVDLLQTHAPQYSTAQRLLIRDVLVSYTLDPATDTGRAWDTYMIFHQVFDQEVHRDIRNSVMSHFFARGRPDLATHVFTRMSKHMRADSRPDANTYVLAFEGIAATGEPDALEIVHNLMKLDTETEPSTRLLNALMLAYSGCGMSTRALDFWRQIAVSGEGPDYQSLKIALRSCQYAPFGHEEAGKIFARLRAADIEISQEIFAIYLASLSGNGFWDLCRDGMKEASKYTGQEVDFYT